MTQSVVTTSDDAADSAVASEESSRPSGTRGEARTVSVQSLRNGAFIVVALVVMAAFAVYGVGRYHALNRADQQSRNSRQAILAARMEVLALTTVSASSSQADIQRLLAGATPGFRAEFQQQAKDFKTALEQADVTSTGNIASAGIESLKGNSATVLVAATGTVKNKNTAKAEPRNYRLRVSLQKTDGRWLVSGMDFVA